MANKNTGIYGHFGTFSATAQLPNVAGADVQTSELSVGDLASVGGALYICTAATPGAAVWASAGGGAGLWTPDAAQISGGVPDTVTGLERPYTGVAGVVSTIMTFDIFSVAGCAASTIAVANFPGWDRSAALPAPVGHVETPTTVAPLAISWVGVGTLTAQVSMPALGAFGTARATAVFQYVATP